MKHIFIKVTMKKEKQFRSELTYERYINEGLKGLHKNF